jgi:hypothetical protein
MKWCIKILQKYIIIILGTMVLISCGHQIPDRNYLNENGKFAMGVYIGRTVQDSITQSIFYEYEINGDSIQQFDMECFRDSEKARDHFYFTKYPLMKGNLFVILYDSLSPANSIIRLDYPLRDSNDFKSSIIKIKKERIREADSLQ